MKKKGSSAQEPNAFSSFLLMHVNSCVLIHVKTQTVAFHDTFLIFERRKLDFERTHKIIPQISLEKLNILCKRCIFHHLDKNEILLLLFLWDFPLTLFVDYSNWRKLSRSPPIWWLALVFFLSPLVLLCDWGFKNNTSSVTNLFVCFLIKVEFQFWLTVLLVLLWNLL